MNFTVFLDNILLESYPPISNARLNVTITHIIDTDGHKGYAQTCDSDWNYYPCKELEFEPEFGETKKSNGKWVALSADQIYDICEEYEAEIVNQLWEYIEELKGEYYE